MLTSLIEVSIEIGAQLWGGCWGRAPSPAPHTLAKDMSLNRRNRLNTWTKAMFYLILPIINIPALKISQLRPCNEVQ